MSIKRIHLTLLTQISKENQLKIRDIRNEENVRKWMYTEHLIKESEHLNWIEYLKSSDKQMVFSVLDENNIPLGVVSLNAIDKLHKKADWAYYLSSDARGGLGSVLEYYFIDFIFNSLDIEKLNCEVIEGNDTVVKLHKKFIFKNEGFRESDLIKNNKRIGIHFLGLKKENWQNGKETIYNKYSKIFNKFEVKINYN